MSHLEHNGGRSVSWPATLTVRYRNLLPALALVTAACSGGGAAVTTPQTSQAAAIAAVDGQAIPPATSATLRNQLGFEFPPAPAVPEGPADDSLVLEEAPTGTETPGG